MSNIRTIGQVTNYKPLRQCDMEELAMRQRTIEPSGGILFARNTDRAKKELARQRIVDLFTMEAWSDDLHILTMPGLDWRFERLLLGSREPGWMNLRTNPHRTKITSIENDRTIYHAAIANMPGLATKNALTKFRPPPDFAEYSIRTKFVRNYYFANVDDLMQTDAVFDAAWLDFTGQLTVERLKIIEAFYNRSVRRILIVTALKGRWNRETSASIKKAGSHARWLSKHLPGDVLHHDEYFDTAAMAQFAVRHDETHTLVRVGHASDVSDDQGPPAQSHQPPGQAQDVHQDQTKPAGRPTSGVGHARPASDGLICSANPRPPGQDKAVDQDHGPRAGRQSTEGDDAMSVMGDALERAGLNVSDFQMKAVLKNYFKSGGTREHLLELVDEVTVTETLGMGRTTTAQSQTTLAHSQPPGEGHAFCAETSQPPLADAGQSLEGAEANEHVPQGHKMFASAPSSDRDGVGQKPDASSGQVFVARPVANEPTDQQRAIAARGAVKASVSVLDTLLINGRAIGDFTVGEARRMGHNKTREGYILLAATRCVANAKGSDMIRDIVKPEEMQRIMQKAAEHADAA